MVSPQTPASLSGGEGHWIDGLTGDGGHGVPPTAVRIEGRVLSGDLGEPGTGGGSFSSPQARWRVRQAASAAKRQTRREGRRRRGGAAGGVCGRPRGAGARRGARGPVRARVRGRSRALCERPDRARRTAMCVNKLTTNLYLSSPRKCPRATSHVCTPALTVRLTRAGGVRDRRGEQEKNDYSRLRVSPHRRTMHARRAAFQRWHFSAVQSPARLGSRDRRCI